MSCDHSQTLELLEFLIDISRSICYSLSKEISKNLFFFPEISKYVNCKQPALGNHHFGIIHYVHLVYSLSVIVNASVQSSFAQPSFKAIQPHFYACVTEQREKSTKPWYFCQFFLAWLHQEKFSHSQLNIVWVSSSFIYYIL